MTLAMAVPCQPSSTSNTLLSLWQKSQPWTSSLYPFPSSSKSLVSLPFPDSPGLVQAVPTRSGFVKSTPVSITATTMDELPSPICHASGRFISTFGAPSKFPTTCPVLWSPHSSPKKGSLTGLTDGCRRYSGSAQATSWSWRSAVRAVSTSPLAGITTDQRPLVRGGAAGVTPFRPSSAL